MILIAAKQTQASPRDMANRVPPGYEKPGRILLNQDPEAFERMSSILGYFERNGEKDLCRQVLLTRN
jgi:hypothetical protein